MIKKICKYYFQFYPITHRTLNFSLMGFMNYVGVDYYHSDPSSILLECDELINKK